MDETCERIADHVSALQFGDLPDDVVHQCRRTVLDTFGCALGAIDAEPAKIARALASRATSTSGARVIGTQHRALPELAAFANGVMARYLDANDAYPGGGGHPSDMIAAILAAADAHGAGGQAIVTAMVAAYDVYHALWISTALRDKGMDNVYYTAVAGAAGAAKILGLDRKRLLETLSLAAVPNVALDATRYGDLSMWKGCAGGNSARNAVFAALLAGAGMTGPANPFAGTHGLEALAGGFTLPPLPGRKGPFRIMEATLKCFASEGHSLSPITVALSLSQQVQAEDIQQVNVYTYRFAWDVIGRGPEKWRPTTRESADHSMPYVVANTLVDGRFTDEIFSPERLRNPAIHALMDRITVTEDPELTRQVPEGRLPCRIEIVTKSGERKVAATDYPRGHYRNPMSDAEVEDKFRYHASRALAAKRVDEALSVLWKIDSAPNLDQVFSVLAA